MTTQSPILRLRCSGKLAIFTNPALKSERFSYLAPPPSALRGLIESILWKPALAWRIHRIHVLAPICFTSFRRNEVNSKAVAPSARILADGGVAPHLFAEEDRAQRNTVALSNVDYLVEARFTLTDRAGEGDNVAKFVAMFERRLENGQHFSHPFLGCRECVADVRPPKGDEVPISETRDLGVMLWDIAFRSSGGKPDNRPIFYWARMVNGTIDVPASEQAAHESLQAYHQQKGGA